MTFKLQKHPTFRTTATINVPTDGGTIAQTLSVRFKVLPEEATALEPVEFLRQAVLSLDDVVDDQDAPLAFSAELLEEVIAPPYVRIGLIRAYWQALAGAKAGN